VSPAVVERFWSAVRKGETCWEWTRSLDGGGYGRVFDAKEFGGREKAHRISWMLHFGPIPDGRVICHHCDNTRCVRPDHLFIGTQADNARDREQKLRGGNSRPFEWKGQRASLREWARRVGIAEGTLSARVHQRRWSFEKAITTPVRRRPW